MKSYTTPLNVPPRVVHSAWEWTSHLAVRQQAPIVAQKSGAQPVLPGDQLILTARLDRVIRGLWKFSTTAYVGDMEVSSAEMMVAPGDPPAKSA